ncbi:hypothetical protein [Botrimarina hoheduenensis]|uniref:Uncharacterized protein n=1 Tax=Botrimarina hoheduenensis TaxID=2528000 RepID=A0A5C5WBQ1_9BACT|nr:hypothetical protein [Botrimarina hoheduenensis]TWT47481.1 hypothetical protein Pla111_10950 [Botrimarina hoheduenensis]
MLSLANARRGERSLIFAALLLAFGGALGGTEPRPRAENPPIDFSIKPIVTRPDSPGEPRLWPVCYSSSGGNEIRNCFAWRHGWPAFAESQGLPLVRRHGALWIHNPGGVVTGQPMRFQQLTRCRQQAELSGNETLALVSRWDEFTEQMCRIAAEGHLLIYLGCPATLKPLADETDEAWLARAVEEIGPVLAIEPRPILAFDATYGHPADKDRQTWARAGGPDGLVALLLKELDSRGYEILVEPAILVEADWLRQRAGVVANEFWWDKILRRGGDFRPPHQFPAWGKFCKPSEITGRQVRLLTQLHRKPWEEQLPYVRATLAAGYDVAVFGGHLNRLLDDTPPK